jgi:hypothetical protein
MAAAGSSALESVRGVRGAAVALLLLLAVALIAAPAADAATSRSAAAKKALAALKTGETDQPVIVFGLRQPLRSRSVIGQAGPGGGPMPRRRAALATRFGKRRDKRILQAGVAFHRADVLMRTGREPMWFFYEDRGPHQNYEHPGRVVLVGARSGRVRTSRQLRWMPLVNGKLPAFLRSAKGYESPAFRVFNRPWSVEAASRARTRQAPPQGSAQQKVADALAAEKSCAFRVSDTLGDFLDFGRVDQTRARLGLFFEGLEKLNAGFVSRRYTTKQGQSPIRAAQALIDEAGCRDLFIYTAGAASRTGEAGIVIGMRSIRGGAMEWHVLTAEDLAALVDANPNVTFKFLIDAPYSGRVTQQLNSRSNVLVTLASSGPDEASFLFLPEIVGPNGLEGNPRNPANLLEFSNAIIGGINSFASSDTEVDHGIANRGGTSMMVWMLTRAMGMSNAWMFSASSENLKLPPNVTPPGALPPPPVPLAAPNRNPVGTTPAQPTEEDTARPITLTATDPDNDPLTFSITDGPDHGDFSGTAPNLTYTPDQDFDDSDEFTYLVEDGRGGSNTQTVQIPIIPDNDAAAVTTTTAGSPTFTEDGSPVVVDGGLTVSDPDSADLVGATVTITDATRQTGDELVFSDTANISGTYNSGTGVLTLTGTAPASEYQAALRSVEFDSVQQAPTTSRTIEFRAEDGDEAGAPATKTVTITPVNDTPVGATNETTALAYAENVGAVAIFPNATITDVDDTMIEGATVAVISGYQNGEDTLAFTNQNGITGAAFNTSTGSLSLSGTATIDQYRDAIRSVTYANSSENPDTTQRIVTFTVSDGDANSAGVLRSIDVTRANDAPVNTVPGAQTTNEDTSTSLTFSVADADAGGDDVEVDLTATNGVMTLATTSGLTSVSGNGTKTVELVGSISEVNAAMTSFTYAPDPNYNGSDTVQMATSDLAHNGGAAQTDTDNVAMTITAVNDAPVNTVPGNQTLDEDDTKVLSGGSAISVDDVDVPAGNDLQVTLGVANGRLTLGGTSGLDFACGTCAGDGTSDTTMTFRGTKSEVNTALDGLTYAPNANYNGSDTLQIVTSDLGQTGSGGTLTDIDTVGFTVNSINDAPVNGVPGAQSTVQNTPLSLPNITVADVDTPSLEMTLDVDHGTLTMTTLTGLTFTTGDGSGDATMVFSGTQSNLNAAMATITYTPDNDFTGDDTLSVKSDDGPLEDNDTVTITIEPANDPPVNSVPGAQTVDEDTDLVFSSLNGNLISTSDPDAGSDPVEVELSVGMGGLTLSQTTGLTFSAGANGGAAMTFQGTLTDVNAALAGMKYRGAGNFNGADSLAMTTDDLGNNGAGGPLEDSDFVAITVNAVNDAPEHLMPAAQNVNEGGTLTLSSANLNQVAVGDVDAGSGTIAVSLDVTNGTLTLAGIGGLTFSNGDGTNDASMDFTGTRTDINTALNGMTFTPTADYDGPAQLDIATDDQGNTGSGGSQTDSDSLAITVNGINDAPTITAPTDFNVGENDSATKTISVADSDAGSGQVQITLGADHGDITLATTSGLTFEDGANGSGAMVFEGTLAQVAAAMTGLTYAPDANYFGPDTLTARIDDNGNTGSGGNLFATDSTAITVDEANSAPVNSVPGTQTFDEDTTRTFSSGNGNAISVTDPDAGTADVTTTLTATGGILDVTASTGDLTTATGDGTNTVTLTGSTAEITAALEGLVYDSDLDENGAETITVLTDDLGNTGAGGNQTDSDVINLSITAVNDAPSLTEPADFDVDEGATEVLSGAAAHQVTDVDAGAGGVEVNLDVDHGTMTLDGTTGLTFDQGDGTGDSTVEFSGTVADVNNALDGMSYTANNNDGSSDTLDATVTDNGNTGTGGALGDSDSVAITINALNEAPVHTVPGTQTFDEDTILAFNTGNGNAISVADGDAGGADVRTTLTSTQGTMTIDTTGLDFSCGSCAGDGGADTTMTFEGTLSEINAALQTLTYDSNANYNGAAQVSITTNDLGNSGGGGPQQDSDNIALSITAVNDAPQNTVPGAQSVDEDTVLTFSPGNGNALSTADADSGSSDVRATLDVDNAGAFGLTLATTSGLNFACGGCSGDGTNDATMVFEGTVAEVNAALNGMTYRGAQNFNGADTLTLTINDLGNTGTGGSLQDQDTVSITVNPVNDIPIATANTFGGAGNLDDQAHGNTTMQVDDTNAGGDDNKAAPTNPHTEIQGDIRADDTDVDGPGPLIVQSAGSDAGATNGQTADGGTVTIEPDGDFVYQPPASTSCDNGTDTFNYKISDQANSGAGPIPGTAIATVTIHLEGCVWYVHNNAAGNAGTAVQPFDTLAQAEIASGANHTVFVFDGDNTSTGYQTGYAMNSGERLIGEHEGLTVDPDQGGSLTADSLHPANPGAHPTISGTNEDVVDLDDGTEVRGFTINPTGTGSGIAGSSGDTGGGTIDDVNIIDTAVAGSQPLLELDSTTGTFNISNLVVDNQAATSPPNTATGVRLNNAGTVNFNPTGQTSIAINGAKGLDAISTNMGSGSTFDDITVAGSSVGGVNLSSTTGTTTFGDGTGADLSLTTTSGSSPAFDIDNAGTVTVAGAGADDVHATGGPAIDVTGTSGPTLEFDDVDSTNSASDGINLDGLGAGTFSATSGDIAGAAGISFDLNGGSGAISYPGNFGNGSGTTAFDITGRSGGTVTLSGPISDTNDAGGTINLAGNTGGSTTFSNGTKQANTGASDGVVFTSSDNHTLNLLNGGLDIDTTSGNGLRAETSGTIEIGTGGSPNTIDATALGASNRGLHISDTDIATGDVTFRHVKTVNGLNGIRVSNSTNANGRLFLTSDGTGACTSAATCSGGAIQNTSDDGVHLTSLAGGAEFMRLAVIDSGNEGIEANSVSNGILLDRSYIFSNGDTSSENGIDYNNVHGTSAVRSSDLIGPGVLNNGSTNFDVTNTSGSMHLTFNDNDVNLAGTDDGMQLTAGGTATMRSSITNNRFDDNKGEGIQIADEVATGIVTDHTITGNTVDGLAGTSTDGGIVVSSDGSARVQVNTNTITNVSVSAIVLNPLGTSAGTTQDMTANSNTIGTAGVQQSGSSDGDGMQLKSATDGTAKVVMSNNNIRGWQGAGMRLRASESTNGATSHLTAEGNTIRDHESGAADAAIWLQAGSGSGDVINFCADVGAPANTFIGGPVNAPAGIADFVLDLRFANSVMRAPNYTGTTLTDRQNYFLGRNTGFSNFAQDGTQNMQNEADGACDQPTPPNAPTAPPALGA